MTSRPMTTWMRTALAVLGLAAATAVPGAARACMAGGDTFLASVCMTAAQYCPAGYQPMRGQLLEISQNQALFALLGCAWGGDCRSTFQIPDMRGRAPVAAGHGPGLTEIALGQSRGAETHSLTVEQLAPHTHEATFTPGRELEITATLQAYSSRASREDPVPGSFLSGGGSSVIFGSGGLGANLVELSGLTVEGSAGDGAVVIGETGSGRSFDIQGPVMALHFCIATEGIFPPRP